MRDYRQPKKPFIEYEVARKADRLKETINACGCFSSDLVDNPYSWFEYCKKRDTTALSAEEAIDRYDRKVDLFKRFYQAMTES